MDRTASQTRAPDWQNEDLDRLPFRASESATGYEAIGRLPVFALLDSVRSMYNVGAFFRTADAVALEKLYLCGITAAPPKNAITKTALGAEERVPWAHFWDPAAAVAELRSRDVDLVAVETNPRAVDLFDWKPRFPVCVVFGHEIDGVRPELIEQCEGFVRIPMLGRKHSLNVASAGAVVLYELLRKYRELAGSGLGTSGFR